eukprot:Tbor_TRINITY_DN4757_c0_g1::TRINITY_DN4757_c0_g1_i1::g.17086::m.17086/K14455/GOT2; aspartate aminotransferase, mitochondrial
MRKLSFCGVKTTAALSSIRLGSSEAFGSIQMGPADPILGITTAYKQDTDPRKVNLGVGVYRDDANSPIMLECVSKAIKMMTHDNYEYGPITGIPSFVSKAQRLAFGEDSAVLNNGRVASSQSLSGTGALRLAGDFLNRHYSGSQDRKIYLPKPTWGNHTPVFRDSGLIPEGYTYYNYETKGINIDGMIKTLKSVPEGSIILLHACAHNPTGMDPNEEEWKEIAHVIAMRNLFPLVDMAYQGFASGDLDKDAFALRLLAEKVPAMVVCQSFAKNFGLYGQRVGAVHFVCDDNEVMKRVESQIKIIIRPMYSNPPLFGAKLVDIILESPELTALWHKELAQMSSRMDGVRTKLVKGLQDAGSQHDWSHITKQIGMMAFSGLTLDQVTALKNEHHIYMTNDGRMAISGLNSTNVDYVAACIHEVTK